MKKVLFLILITVLLLTSCTTQQNGIQNENNTAPPTSDLLVTQSPNSTSSNEESFEVSDLYSYIGHNGIYGNMPYAAIQQHRRMVETENYIFMCDPVDEYPYNNTTNIYCIEKETLNQMIVASNVSVGQMSFYNGCLFFSDWNYANNSDYYSKKLFRVKPNETKIDCIFQMQETEEEFENSFTSFQIVNDRIYVAGSEPSSVFSINLDGEDQKHVADVDSLFGIQVWNDKIYYYCANDLWESSLDSSNMRHILKNVYRSRAFVWGNTVYYNEKSAICKLNLETFETEILVADLPGDAEMIFYADDNLFYTFWDNTEEKTAAVHLSVIQSDGVIKELANDVIRLKYSELEPVVIDGQLYYWSDQDDGSNPRKIDLS